MTEKDAFSYVRRPGLRGGDTLTRQISTKEHR